jgi:hypothetical protein
MLAALAVLARLSFWKMKNKVFCIHNKYFFLSTLLSFLPMSYFTTTCFSQLWPSSGSRKKVKLNCVALSDIHKRHEQHSTLSALHTYLNHWHIVSKFSHATPLLWLCIIYKFLTFILIPHLYFTDFIETNGRSESFKTPLLLIPVTTDFIAVKLPIRKLHPTRILIGVGERCVSKIHSFNVLSQLL